MLKYKILKRLGAGGMGEVYLAQDTENSREVAVKILQPQYSSSSESRERFLREMKVNAELEHPHIIRVYDYGESEGTLYFVMQHVQGRSLKEVIADGAMDVHDAVDRVEEIASALEYIHPRDLIHRDLKPANIMLDSRGKAILLDFGLVKALAEVSLTTTGKVIGTPRYMAPEMMLTGKVDLRSDIYQLGCIFYELCTGKHAVPGKTRKEVAERCLYEVPLPPGEHNPEVDPDLANLIWNTLEKNPDERYPDAPTLISDIKAYREGKTIARLGSGKPARQRPQRKRRRTGAMQRASTASQQRVSGSQASPEVTGANPRVSASMRASAATGAPAQGPSGVNRGATSRSSGATRPPAGAGYSSGMSRSLDTEGMTMSADMIPPTAVTRRPGPVTSAERTAQQQAGSQQALAAAAGLTLLLLVILGVTLFSGPSYTVRNLSSRAVYAGGDVSWESSKPYPSRVEAWTDPSSPRVFSSEETGGLLHRVELRGLEPGRTVTYRVLLPEGDPSPEKTFQPLDLKPERPKLKLKSAFKGEVTLDLGEVPARVVATIRPGTAEPYDSREEWARHDIPVELPEDGSSVRVRIDAVQGKDRKVPLFKEIDFPGIKDRLRAMLDGSESERSRLWPPLAKPIRDYLSQRVRASPAVKAWIYEAFEGLRDEALVARASGGGVRVDPDKVLPKSFRVVDSMPVNRTFKLQLARPLPLIAFADQYQRSSSKIHELEGVLRGVPASAANARAVAFGFQVSTPSREPSVLRITLGGLVTLSIYFGDGRERDRGKTLLHSFDPRLLGRGGEIPVRIRYESLTGKKLGRRGNLIVSDLKLVVQN